METVVAALIADDDKDASTKESVTEFLDDIISILSFNLEKKTERRIKGEVLFFLLI
jgi:hypothetical protein